MTASALPTLTLCFWAGPGVGKSVTAAMTFGWLKIARVSAELACEYAKDLTYEGVLAQTAQRDILTEQLRRVHRPQGHVDVVVTDAPPAVSLLYAHEHEKAEVAELLAQAPALNVWNILLHRDLTQHYEQRGRWQPPSEAMKFHNETVAPFVRQLPALRVLELHVDDVKTKLVPLVLEHLALQKQAA